MTDTLQETKQAFHDPQWYFQKRSYHVRVRVETVLEFLKDARPLRILDIGCGDGSISLPLLTAKNRLTLLDMSDGMLARAKSRVPEDLCKNVELIKGDFMSARLEPGAYDLIICVVVMAYVESPADFLQKLASLLKPEGQLILEWTDGSHFINRSLVPYNGLMGLLRRAKVTLVRQSGAQLLAALRQLGFETAGRFRYCSPLPVIRRILGEDLNYRLIRAVHGSATRNRTSWLGEECIYHFRRTNRSAFQG
jgi:2-polyprenyl-3-methyl-5-hydroxy-6-metoxy-1,4-benzoquinol methylase